MSMTGVLFGQLALATWVFSDRCRSPLIVWGRIFPNCSVVLDNSLILFFPIFSQARNLSRLSDVKFSTIELDAGGSCLGLPYPHFLYIDHLSLLRSLEAHNSISLNQFNCHVGGHQRSLVPFLGPWPPPLPGLRVSNAKLSPVLLILRVLEKEMTQTGPRPSFSLAFPRYQRTFPSKGPISIGGSGSHFGSDFFRQDIQSNFYHIFHCLFHKNDMRGSFGVSKNHCHNSLAPDRPSKDAVCLAARTVLAYCFPIFYA